MHKIIRYFYENKIIILRIISGIILFFIIIQLLNNMYKTRQKQLSEDMNNIDSRNSTIDNYSDYIITQKNNISESDSDIIKSTMEEFVNYCNENEIEKAYNMLTDECKEILYKDIEIFYDNYVSNIFTEKKYYTMQAWSTQEDVNTFLINYEGDILANGGKNEIIQEYDTFIKQSDNTYKININNYIYSENFENLITEVDKIKFEIISMDVFKDYVEYEFRIYNQSEDDILLNGDKYRKSIYLLGNNDATYSSINSEFNEKDEIIVKANNSKKFKVRFNKVYNTSITIKKMIFNDIVFNYEEYEENKQMGNEYENRGKIEVNLF